MNQRNYWVVRLGEGNKYASVAYKRNCIAIGWDGDIDLTKFDELEQKEFVGKIAPRLRESILDRSEKYYAGSARQMYKFAALIKPGDVVMMPADEKVRYLGIVKSEYYYAPQEADLPYRHRRDVEWVKTLQKSEFSEKLRNSTGAIMTMFNISKHAEEIENLLGDTSTLILGKDIESVEDFGMESHLEDFVVENWDKIDEFKNYEIIKDEEGEIIGQQYVTDIGRIDILAKSKESNEWLIIELKKGKSSDDVVGQTLRYMGWVTQNEADSGDQVKGLIIAGKEDERLRYALSVLPSVDFMTYQVNFTLKRQAK